MLATTAMDTGVSSGLGRAGANWDMRGFLIFDS